MQEKADNNRNTHNWISIQMQNGREGEKRKHFSFKSSNTKPYNFDFTKKDQEKQNALSVQEQLTKVRLKIKVKAGENGKIFGSITSKEIATELKNQQNIEIDKKKILLKEAIKELGVFNIDIRLYEGIIGKLKIDIIS